MRLIRFIGHAILAMLDRRRRKADGPMGENP
jgi:hypothetical protein